MDNLSNFIDYLQATKNLSSKTLKAYSSDLKQFFEYETNILQPDVCAFISYLNTILKLRDSSIRRKIITLKNFYDYLIDAEVIETSPFKKLKFKFKQEKKLPKTLSIPEISKLLKCFDIDTALLSPFALKEFIRDAALIDLLVSTGIRIGEAATITIDDIIASEHTLLIHGKGRKQRLIYISSPITWERIKAQIKECKKLNSPHLFTNRYGHPLSIHGIEDIYKKSADKHEIHSALSAPYFCH